MSARFALIETYEDDGRHWIEFTWRGEPDEWRLALGAVRLIPGARFDPERKVWRIEATAEAHMDLSAAFANFWEALHPLTLDLDLATRSYDAGARRRRLGGDISSGKGEPISEGASDGTGVEGCRPRAMGQLFP